MFAMHFIVFWSMMVVGHRKLAQKGSNELRK